MAKTVKVRIAVRVTTKGKWLSAGWDGASDKAKVMATTHDEYEDAIQEMVEGTSFWVEAELPIPKALVVRGKVEEVRKSKPQ